MRPVLVLALAGLATAQTTRTITEGVPTTSPTTTTTVTPSSTSPSPATTTVAGGTATETAIPTGAAIVHGPVAGLVVVGALCAALL
ncbi:uncharacterized protein B0T15DRAFT_250977 [Chaetomium strumarium]|uniref:Uncharacterized protein n=1 Tax=Chaetomium strumarium TaxID=1170767 RepID=A0AAJ0GR99_9PEZI|nr:hypothetical protein B0T15DRAFT_250977 [Chaetomium strumarium]